MYIEDIPCGYIPALAKLLQFRPNEGGDTLSSRIAKGVKALPSFLRPSRLEKILLPPRGHLCQLHKPLNYDAVDVVLHHVQLEVGVRLNSLISQCDLLSPEQYVRVMRLRALHALWLTPEDYEKTFLTSSQDSKWSYQSDRCRACILSRITCDLEILLDLRWAVRSRATQNFVATHGIPRLQSWVQVWIAALARCVERAAGQKIDLDTVMLQNEEQAVALKKTRAAIETVRKEKYKYMKLSRTKSGRTRAKRVDSCRLVPNPPAPAEREAAETTNMQDTRDNHAGEDLPGEPDEAELQGMDPYKALTSTTYLPSQPHPHVQHPFESDISSVSGDPSMKGQSPYGRSSSATERASIYTILEDSQTAASQELRDPTDQDEELEYVSPRSQWKTPPQEPSTLHTPPTGSRGRDQQYQPPFVSSRDSWETERFMESSSSIYSCGTAASSRTQKRHVPRSRQRLTRVDEDEDEYCGSQTHSGSRVGTSSSIEHNPPAAATPRRDAAETYTNLLAPSPFAPTSETPSRPGPGACTPPASASELFLHLYNKVSRPTVGPGATTPSPESTPYSAPRRVPSTPPRRTASSTQDFLNLYDEVVGAYSRDRNSGSSSAETLRTESTSTSVSTTTRKSLTPERLSARASTSNKPPNQGRGAGNLAVNSDVHVRERAASGTSPSQSKGAGRSRSQSRSHGHKQSRVQDSRDDVQSTWSGAYESEIASRDDLGWYYHGKR